jgi:DNA-binding XRE family transcriptional regulator
MCNGMITETVFSVAMFARGWTSTELAKELGVSRVTVCKWREGNHRPTPERREKIANLLCLSENQLWPYLHLEARAANRITRAKRARKNANRKKSNY